VICNARKAAEVIQRADAAFAKLIDLSSGDGSQSQYSHVWGQSTLQGGSTRSVTKLIAD
jgi:hypothetical protein